MSRRRSSLSTRRQILRAAFVEIHRHGFLRADLESIARQAGVTKGAVYHHFSSKLGLAHAVVEELLRDWIVDRWLAPVADAVDPLAALTDLARWAERAATPEGMRFGCPLQGLAQEMSSLDEGLRLRLAEIYQEWRDGLAAALRRGQHTGAVDAKADVDDAAAFIVAAWEGSIGLAKSERRRSTLTFCRRGLESFLRTLRPRSAR